MQKSQTKICLQFYRPCIEFLPDKFAKINEAQNAWFNQIKQENHKKYEKLHALLFFYNLYEDRLEGRSEFDILYILTKGKIRRIKDLEAKYLLKKYGKKIIP